MSTKTFTHRPTSPQNRLITPETVLVGLFVGALVAIYGALAMGLVAVGLGPAFLGWMLGIAILGAGPLAAVWLVGHALELVE